jgi:hypothetical protein
MGHHFLCAWLHVFRLLAILIEVFMIVLSVSKQCQHSSSKVGHILHLSHIRRLLLFSYLNQRFIAYASGTC